MLCYSLLCCALKGVEAVDLAVAKASSAVDRMKKLLASPDKKVNAGGM